MRRYTHYVGVRIGGISQSPIRMLYLLAATPSNVLELSLCDINANMAIELSKEKARR